MKNLIYLTVIIIFIFSCTEDFFSKEVKLDPLDYKSEIVCEANLSNLENTSSIYVSKTIGLLEQAPDSAYFLKGANVEIFENGALWKTFNQSRDLDNNIVYISKEFKLPITDRMYTVKINHPEFPSATANQIMPDPIQIISTKGIKDGGKSINGDKLSQIDITIQDLPNKKNYYAISAFGKTDTLVWERYDNQGNVIGTDTFINRNQLYFETNGDLSLVEGVDAEILISDELFEGKQHKLSIKVSGFNVRDGIEYTVVVKNITEDYFRYSATEARRYYSEDFPLAEPITAFSNLNNGFGIFRLANASMAKIIFE